MSVSSLLQSCGQLCPQTESSTPGLTVAVPILQLDFGLLACDFIYLPSAPFHLGPALIPAASAGRWETAARKTQDK